VVDCRGHGRSSFSALSGVWFGYGMCLIQGWHRGLRCAALGVM